MMEGRVPKIRFKIFQELWESKRLSEACDEFIGGGTPSTQSEELWQGTIPWVSSSDIFDDKIHNFQISRFISEEAVKNSATKKIPSGSILVVSRVGVGKVAVTKQEIATSQDFTNLLINNQYSPIFTAYYFKAKNNKLVSIAQGTSIKGFTTGDLKSFKINFPSLPEQQKIASFLSSVDERIELLERKKEKLEAYKKGVMQQIFSQQIRFKQEDGSDFPDWEEKRLGEVCEITTGKLDANAMVPNGKYRFYTCAKEFYWIDKFAFDKEALLISGNGANVGYVHYYKGKFNAYQRTYVLSELTEDFIFVKYFLDENLRKRIHSEKKDGNTPYIVMGTLTEMKLNLPIKEEQKKIAAFLNTLDENLETLDSQIQGLRTWKKGLLQQMFV